MPPLVLFQKEKEYLQPLPSDDVIESYLPHDRQTTVRSDSLVTYHNYKYSVPPEYIGKPVRLLVSDNTLRIYSSTDLIAAHYDKKDELSKGSLPAASGSNNERS